MQAVAERENETVHVTLIIENEKGRQALLDRAHAELGAYECLVKVTDLIGLRRAMRTTPLDPRATLVAREVPVVLRGGLTSMVTYYRAPLEGLAAREQHGFNGTPSHEYVVEMRVARIGSKPNKQIAA